MPPTRMPLTPRNCTLWALFVVAAMLSLPLSAQEFSAHPHSRARLITDSTGLAPGATTVVGLHIRLDNDWHAYWSNPGDSGAAPLFEWKVPDGVTITGPNYPLPTRFDTPPLTSFGYARDVMYLFDVTVPASYQGPNPIELRLSAEWLVCKIECIPAFGDFSWKAQLTNSFTPSPNYDAIQAYKGQLPQLADAQTVRILALRSAEGQSIQVQVQNLADFTVADFYPNAQSGLPFQRPSIQKLSPDVDSFTIMPSPGATVQRISGVLVLQSGERNFGVTIDQPIEIPTKSHWELMQLLVFAFLGGIILNLMPCVFPIISIKLLGIMQHAHGDRRLIQRDCMAYVAGVVASFVALGGSLAALRSAGTLLGWGFQLQSPIFVAFLCILFAVLAASFLGMFNIQVSVGSAGRLMQREGAFGQFMTGVLSAVVASPCTAPFMGFAMGAAMSQETPMILATFAFLGLGLGSPYLLFMARPTWLSHLPRPGAWMETLRQFMAFPLLATTLWLLWVLGQVANQDALIATLAAMLVLGLAFWIHRRLNKTGIAWLIATTSIVAGLFLTHHSTPPESASQSSKTSASHSGVIWQPFTPENLAAAIAGDRPVFVNFTADWCITCKVNERVAFRHAEVGEFFRANNIVALQADWTKRDRVIAEVLARYHRIGVPLYLFWAAEATEPIVLPEVLTPGLLMSNLGEHLKPLAKPAN